MSSGVTSMAAEIEDLKAEIERLRREIKGHLKAWDIEHAEVERLLAEIQQLHGEYPIARNNIIEECARVADGFGDKYYFMSAVDIAAAIRALKDKP